MSIGTCFVFAVLGFIVFYMITKGLKEEKAQKKVLEEKIKAELPEIKAESKDKYKSKDKYTR